MEVFCHEKLETLRKLGSMFSVVFVKLCCEFVVVFGSVVPFTLL